MATYNGKRVPSVSNYLNNLNVITPDHHPAAPHDNTYSFDDSLAAFTNTEFIEFDAGVAIAHSPIDYDPTQDDQTGRADGASPESNATGLDFVNDNFQFSDLSPFLPTDPALNIPQQSAPNPYPTRQQTHTGFSSPTSAKSTSVRGSKRPASAVSVTDPDLEDVARVAAEEDKRRRNTAASARFRVKKKQREQAMERTAKDLNDKNSHLEQKLGQLQVENEWLKSLVIEKKGKDYLAEEWKAFKRRAGSHSSSSDDQDRSPEGRKKGVGT